MRARERRSVSVRSVSLVAVIACAACGAGTPRGWHEAREPLVCPHDATPAGGVCRCAPGLTILDGACVGGRELDAYCGAPALASGSCRALGCPRGEPIDLASHTCAPASAARALVARVRPIPDDLSLGCHDDRALVLRGDDVACVLLSDLCPRATTWDSGASRCVPVAACAPGQIRGVDGCVEVVTRESEGAPVLDVGQWTRTMLGTNGGEGTSRLCSSLAEHTAELDIGPGGARTLTLSVNLTFPNNDVTQVSARAETFDTASHQSIAGVGAVPAQKALDPLLVVLRALGGVADAASATVRVRCTVHGGGSPVLAPREAP